MESRSEHQQHHSNLSAFVRACNDELAQRGFECAEVWVMATLLGEAIMHRSFPTNGKTKTGETAVISLQVKLPIPTPWVGDHADAVYEVVSGALAQSEMTSMQICSKERLLRVPFKAYLERQAPGIEQTNGHKQENLRIVTP